MIKRVERCPFCRFPLIRWRTKTGIKGLSGWKCMKGCNGILAIDQYPYDLQTKELRQRIIKKEEIKDPKKITRLEWVRYEQNFQKAKI